MYVISCTQVVYHGYCYVVVLWCSLFKISVDINIMCLLDVSADSKSQSTTTPTATPPSTNATSQKPGE